MKYRLIKEYPGSYKLGFIIENGYYHDQLHVNPQDYPEFWKLIIEKDYEILSFKVSNGYLYNKINNSDDYLLEENVCDGETNTYDNMINNINYKIHSVKRLSDGEIFTIGDKIRFIDESLEKTYPCRIIKKFKIKNNTLIAICDDNGVKILLENLKQVKQPLFTTEDGVDIFDGDYYYPVEKLYYFLHEKQTNHHCTNEEKFWIFSTKEKAEEYILMNKPCLSLNEIFKDVEEMRKGLKTFENSQLAKRFKKLVKQKLNNNN
jgi:hypothetical protein